MVVAAVGEIIKGITFKNLPRRLPDFVHVIGQIVGDQDDEGVAGLQLVYYLVPVENPWRPLSRPGCQIGRGLLVEAADVPDLLEGRQDPVLAVL